MMDAEQIDKVLRGEAADPNAEALRSLADLSVSLLRMIDSRRERGIAFEDSYNEQELRRALGSMVAQEWPPGPPMVHVRPSCKRSIADVTGLLQAAERVAFSNLRLGDQILPADREAIAALIAAVNGVRASRNAGALDESTTMKEP